MGNSVNKNEENFRTALQGAKIPILTLDNKWYRLLGELEREAVKENVEALNSLIRRQGKLNTEVKDIKRLKLKLMNEIVPLVEEAGAGENPAIEKKLDENKRLIEECNEKMYSYQDELLELPREIDRINFQLMLQTMEFCYDIMQENTRDISQIKDWVSDVRIELKKNLIRKQDMEQKNHAIYSYMHDIFGAEVINLFDMKYNPGEQHPKIAGDN